jgi:DNA-directed RNA polymerase specialized sigma24 family protein
LSTADPTLRNAHAVATVMRSKRVLRSIRAVLRFHGWRKRDLRDGVAEVHCRLLEWARNPVNVIPLQPDACAKLCATIAINWCIDEDRKRDTRAPHEEGLCPDPDEYGPREPPPARWELLDMKRMLAQFQGQLARGEMPAQIEQIVVAIAEGKTSREISEELGIPSKTVESRLANARRLFRARLAALGLALVVAMVALLAIVPVAGIAMREDPTDGGASPQVAASVHPQRVDMPRQRTASPCADAGRCEQLREMNAKPGLR